MTIKPKLLSNKLLEEKDILTFLNLELLPILRRWSLKIGGLLNQPTEFGLGFWDGQTWHSASAGPPVNLPDAATALTIGGGVAYVARRGSMTASHANTLSATGAVLGDTMFFVNLSEFSLSFGALAVPAGYIGFATWDGAAWGAFRRFPFGIDPTPWT